MSTQTTAAFATTTATATEIMEVARMLQNLLGTSVEDILEKMNRGASSPCRTREEAEARAKGEDLKYLGGCEEVLISAEEADFDDVFEVACDVENTDADHRAERMAETILDLLEAGLVDVRGGFLEPSWWPIR